MSYTLFTTNPTPGHYLVWGILLVGAVLLLGCIIEGLRLREWEDAGKPVPPPSVTILPLGDRLAGRAAHVEKAEAIARRLHAKEVRDFDQRVRT